MKLNKCTLLWQLTSNTADLAPSYLLGTMHARHPAGFRHWDSIRACLDSCTAFAAEYALESTDSEIAQDMMAGFLPEGQQLDQLLGQKVYQKLRRAIRKSVGFDLHFYRRLQPLLISHLVDEHFLDCDPAVNKALDAFLWDYASEHGKVMLGVETQMEQIAILRQIPLDQQLRELRHLGRNLAAHRRHLLNMIDLYDAGDLQGLYQSARRGSGNLRRLMIFDRNRIMAGRIAAMVNEQSTFVAVGAAHLGGEKGILRFLKKEGIGLKPVSRPGNPPESKKEAGSF